MCCSTGVCGPAVDPQLPRFAADLEWLARKGVSGRAIQPGATARGFRRERAGQAGAGSRRHRLPAARSRERCHCQQGNISRAGTAGPMGPRARRSRQVHLYGGCRGTGSDRSGHRLQLRALFQVSLRPRPEARSFKGRHGIGGKDRTDGQGQPGSVNARAGGPVSEGARARKWICRSPAWRSARKSGCCS